MTTHNLAKLLTLDEESRQEGAEMLRELASIRGGHYAKTWYVARDIGAEAFHQSTELEEAGQEEKAGRAASESARWYARAILRRPRLYIEGTDPRFWQVKGIE